ncbi:DUF2442 domain-containing protein [uncultured Algoriphagus sp.]|uniref:DUF2442 domain-containing protein n=1 Tax=uncultured Algoriphagus sp. TaxID=417365 RepID=UPI00338E618D
MSILTNLKTNIAKDISFTSEKMIIYLEDGRDVSIPLEWFPKLRDASLSQLSNWRFIGGVKGSTGKIWTKIFL